MLTKQTKMLTSALYSFIHREKEVSEEAPPEFFS